MRRRNFILVFLALAIFVGAFITYRRMASFQSLTINIPSGTSAKVFKATDDNGNYDPKSTPIASTNSSTTLKIKKDSYVVAAQASSDYKPTSQTVELSIQPETVTLNPSYTDHKLSSLLEEQRADIIQIIAKKYSSLGDSYTVGTMKLYTTGEWCGVLLTPKDPNTVDVRRLILNKKNGVWVIATDPPSVVVSAPVYPDIPKDVLSDVNNFL